MIDSYGLMALPLAALIAKKRKFKYLRHTIIIALFILTVFNQFQIQQYRNGAIHYWWMNKEAYWETFLKLRPTCKYWKVIQIPNYEKARKGVYEYTHSIDKNADIEDRSLKKIIIYDCSIMESAKRLKDKLKEDNLNAEDIFLIERTLVRIHEHAHAFCQRHE